MDNLPEGFSLVDDAELPEGFRVSGDSDLPKGFSLSEESDLPEGFSLADEEEPGIGKTVAGLGAEVAVGEGAKYAGAATGFALGGPVGAVIGYGVGALAGGVGGSLLAQEIEGRDEASWGRVTADTALNLIPGGLGKASKGARLLPRLAKEGTKRAAGGALISTAGAQIEKGVEQGELLTPDELGNAVLVGGGLGLGLGAAGELMKKAYPRFGGKSGEYLNEAYDKGDLDAAQIAETLAGENPVGMGSRFMRSLYRNVIPSKLVGMLNSPNEPRNKYQSITLLEAIEEHGFDCCIGGARRDEEKARAKERIMSFRDEFGQWDPKNQRPELWDLYNARVHKGENIRAFPISNWTEMDVWQYIEREQLELPNIYYAHQRDVVKRNGAIVPVTEFTPPKPGELIENLMVRFRTVGDITCTAPVLSHADTVEKIILETASTIISERGETRLDDQMSEAAMEQRKKEGYF